MKSIAIPLFLATLYVPAARAANLTLTSDRDATLIEDAAGKLANGGGPEFFAGRTGQAKGSVRRALVRFDLSAIPKHAVIESVRLKLHVSQATPGTSVVSVLRVLDDWGEGLSFATGGGGVPALPGDSTWTHRFYDPLVPAPPPPPASPRSSKVLWRTAGGDYEPMPSASLAVPAAGTYFWEDPRLVADVRDWIKKPKRNFGWLLVGDETKPSTARRFDSRQGMFVSDLPQLEVSYSHP